MVKLYKSGFISGFGVMAEFHATKVGIRAPRRASDDRPDEVEFPAQAMPTTVAS